MKEQKQKRRRHGEEEDDVQARDVRDEDLDQDTDAVLDEIDCCLAEVKVENELAAKLAAKAEWDEILLKRAAGEVTQAEMFYRQEEWAMKYNQMFVIYIGCCGRNIRPDFGDLE